jgi:hypothetical protein
LARLPCRRRCHARFFFFFWFFLVFLFAIHASTRAQRERQTEAVEPSVQRQVSTLEYNTFSQAQSQSLGRFVVIVPCVLRALLPLTLAGAASDVLLDRGNGVMRGSTTLLTARARTRAAHQGRPRLPTATSSGSRCSRRRKTSPARKVPSDLHLPNPTVAWEGRGLSLLAGAMFQGSEGD